MLKQRTDTNLAIVSIIDCYALSRLKWKSFRVRNNFFGQIDVNLRPVIVPRRRLFDIKNLPDRNILEPRELIVWHE